jgi:predicted RNase H-like nuclease (RuvC/YqgF family)
MNKIEELQKEYIQLLTDELNEVVGMASIHGWKSSRAEEGERLRQAIAASQPGEQPVTPAQGEEWKELNPQDFKDATSFYFACFQSCLQSNASLQREVERLKEENKAWHESAVRNGNRVYELEKNNEEWREAFDKIIVTHEKDLAAERSKREELEAALKEKSYTMNFVRWLTGYDIPKIEESIKRWKGRINPKNPLNP